MEKKENRILRSYGRRAFLLFTIHYLLFTLFISCMREDLTLCEPSASLSLSFLYDKESEEKIEDICVLLFDRDSLLYRTHLWTVTDPDTFGEVTVPMEAGDYYVVAFGNITDDLLLTRADAGTHFEALHLPFSDELALFYAPSKEETRSREYENYQIEVVAGTDNRHTLTFLPAFHRIQVYLKGLEEAGETTISLLEVAGGYDLHLEPGMEKTSYVKHPEEVFKEGETLLQSTFFVPHFDAVTPMAIRVENAADGQVDTVSLEEIIRKEHIIPSDGSCLTIEVLFIYKENILVEVILPSWQTLPTEPGF